MYDYLKRFINTTAIEHEQRSNVFYSVSEDDVVNAETMLGFKFPDQLRSFFCEIGYGFLVTPENGAHRENVIYVNRFCSPISIAELYLGIYEFGPEEGFAKGELPFFETSDNYYLVMRPFSSTPNAVYATRGNLISSSLEEFVIDLYRNPEFYLLML